LNRSRAAEGLERCNRACWKDGHRSAAAVAERKHRAVEARQAWTELRHLEMIGCAGFPGSSQNLLNDIEPPGSSWGSFGNEQIAHVLLDEMTAVHGVLRNFEPAKS